MADEKIVRGQFRGSSLTIEADEATGEQRILAGVAVPWGEVGFTNWGPVEFKQGALDASATPPLDRDHDMTRVIGAVRAASATKEGMSVRAYVSKTPVGDETIVLAGDKAITGFSVEVLPTEWSFREDEQHGGVLVVSKAEWVGLAVTPHPAFDSARIDKVAASRRAAIFASTPNPKEPAVAENTLTLDAAAFAPITALVAQMEADRKADAERIAAAEKVESDRLEAKRARLSKKVAAEIEAAGLTASELAEAASDKRTKKLDELTVDELDEVRDDLRAHAPAPTPPAIPATPKRDKVFANIGDAAWHLAQAQKGDAQSIAKLKASWEEFRIKAALSEVTSDDVPGLLPPTYVNELLDPGVLATPVVDSLFIHRPLPSVGMSIIRPQWDTPPDGDWYTVENSQPATNTIAIGTTTVPIQTYAHAIRASMNIVERSAFGGLAQNYYDEVSIDYMAKKEAKATETLVFNAQETNTSAATTPQGEIGVLVAAIIANQQDGDGNFRGLMPNYVAMAPDVWGEVIGTTTLNGFAFTTGDVNYGSVRGTLAGLTWVLAPSLDAGGILVGSTAAARAYDGPELNLRALIVNTMSVELGVYAWTAFDVTRPNALACNFAASL